MSFGSFDQCLEIDHYVNNNPNIKGQYCLASVEIKLDIPWLAKYGFNSNSLKPLKSPDTIPAVKSDNSVTE